MRKGKSGGVVPKWVAIMHDVTDTDWFEGIRAFVDNEDGSFPELADLPAAWDATSPDSRDSNFPDHSARHVLILSYINRAFTKRWAWDGLNRLLVALEKRREPVPDYLKDWACSVVSRRYLGKLKIPSKPRNPRDAVQDDRDFRIMRVYNVLLQKGWSEKKAKDEIMMALGHTDDDAIRSVFRQMENFYTFKPVTKKRK